MDDIDVVKGALDKVKVIDPHCHLRPQKPSADSFTDILLYHHLWIELVSSGMGLYDVTKSGLPHELVDPGIDPRERISRASKYLKYIKTTTVGLFFRWILKDLYGFGDEIHEGNIEEIHDRVGERARDFKWQEQVLRERCGIEYNITVTTEGEPYSDRMLKGREGVPVNIVREYIVSGKQTPRDVLISMENSFGNEINNASDYRGYIQQSSKAFDNKDYKFAGIWIIPEINFTMANDAMITKIIRKAKEGKMISEEEAGSFCYFGTCCFLHEMRKYKVRVIQLLTGAYVMPPHRSVTRWNKDFIEALGKLAYDFEDFHFNASAASDIYTHDMGVLAKHIPNISLLGYWWHMLYPYYIKKSLETRLDMVPINKIVGYFSDTYHSEWCYPKLKMVKGILLEILSERMKKGWYDVQIAVDIVNKIFYENPKRIYQI